jgi:acetyl-CoA synthetase
MYQRSIDDPDGFWGEMAEQFHWFRKWDTVRSFNYNVKEGPISIKWFEGGKTNITTNCLDRHLDTRGDQTAIIWEGNEPGEDKKITYANCTPRSASSPTSSRRTASRRVTGSASTCR